MFIAFAGIDGSGKSTQVNLLFEYLKNRAQKVIITKAFGQEEHTLFDDYFDRMDSSASLFLFHGFHVQHRIRTQEALGQGYIVISDRWSESFIAHASLYGILSDKPQLRIQLEQIAYQNLQPTIYFLIDLDPRIANERMKKMKNKRMDVYDRLSLDYHKSIRDKYLQLATDNQWIVLDGSDSIQKIHHKVVEVVNNHLVINSNQKPLQS